MAGTEEGQPEDVNVEPQQGLSVGTTVECSTEISPFDCVASEISALEADQESITMQPSVDSDDTDVSTRSQSQPATQTEGIIFSRGNGVVVVSSAQMPIAESHAASTESASNEIGEGGDEDVWETVEVRPRGTRKKAPGASVRNGQVSSGNQASSTGSQVEYGHGSKKNKALRSPITRKKSAAGKVVREVVFSLLDSVDDEATRRQQPKEVTPVKQQQNLPVSASQSVEATNPWNRGPPLLGGAAHSTSSKLVQSTSTSGVKQGASLRDVVLGLHTSVAPTPVSSSQGTVSPALPFEKKPISFAKAVLSPGKVLSRAKANASSGADQNTAPTYQETASSHSNIQTAAKSCPTSVEDRVSKSDSSTVDTEDAPRGERLASAHRSKLPVPAPPLPTMLSAENPNSANSSVASSLEVPHSSRRHHHHHTSTTGVNDVGYHLLDVCDRLSQDMNLFMSRRSLALNARRRERGALLSALQSTVVSLWPSRGHVEMYGSCATYLDLPSSDLDVVVVGLDRATARSLTVADPRDRRKASDKTQLQTSGNDSIEESIVPSLQGTAIEDSQVPLPVPLGAYASIPLPKNAERVVRLAAALESQPWAVQIKSIPTASVPVIKILADPSKLTGTASVSEWLSSQEHFASQAAAAAGFGASESSPQHEFPPLWRGADVINGLLKLDITFEGPEHGGIGSTQFSTQVVADACQESGLNPDATPLVQVIMVLKEILAQRKLNEPYSGGLSSYALLLLVVALLQERTVIREEIERSERQRQAMASGDGNASFVASVPTDPPAWEPNARPGEKTSAWRLGGTWAERAKMPAPRGKGTDASEKSNVDSRAFKNSKQASALSEQPTKPSHKPASVVPSKSTSSSWASVAKINSGGTATNPSASKSSIVESQSSGERSKPSFADALSGAASKIKSQSEKSQPKRDMAAAIADSARESAPLEPNRPAQTDVSTLQLNSKGSGASTSSPSLTADTSIGAPSFYPQGYNDVIEVLCSGETTAGKLLMHFLLYYGQHFDAQSTAIDVSGKHERDFGGHASPSSYYSPFIPRRSAGVIDPVTGMLTVEPIVIYDPLEGAESNNVARRCFAWSSVRWVFAQSYATLSSAVERSSTPPTTPGGAGNAAAATESNAFDTIPSSRNEATMGDLMDPSSPLLRCLLSF